ncbi:uncharacterized protein N7446_007320 [Penicillium canescens]|uniref:uncharacterized protein n=1 Tax=Penicillium canescens TaxID=5083 RepID=UPI0026DFF437|nr:uncharacterized protein N7446_007320 [Penicillium canescens]KAJ6063200.1 hypothetical protein N7446_007320 [Penicillium canescens]
MTCRYILLGLDSAIKIELMQKYTKDNRMVRVDDLDRWPVDSDAVGFLSAISTITLIETLKQKNSLFINKNRSRGKLVLLARIVILSTKIFYLYDT